jgi:outer membrane receptor protein involved in Fe transport
MRTIFYFVVIACFGAVQLKAQTVSVEGRVAIGDGSPLQAANITLMLAADSSIQKLALSDASGKYRFDGVKKGAYLLQASHTGYKTTCLAPFELQDKLYTAADIAMAVEPATQQAATVTGKKPFIEQKAGKTVMNVENSIMASGNTVMELIEKAPGVSVDKDDNINIRGRQGVIVLIDGKPQQLSAADLANMLRNMPGVQVESIEIITQASAKYDAGGNSGMINIRTKKLRKAGLNGNVNATGGQDFYPRYSLGGNINYRKNKVNLFGNYNYANRKTTEQLELTREVKFGGTTVFDQYNFNPSKRKTHTAKAGMDYQLNRNTSFGIVADGFLSNGQDLNNYSRTKIGTALTVIDSSLEVYSNKHTLTKNGSISFNFRHRFDSTGKELTFDADRSFFNRDGDEFLDNFYYLQFNKSMPMKSPLYLRNHALSDIGITVVKADYTHPLKKNNAKIEAGLKHSYVNGDNDLRFDSLSGGVWVKDKSKTNHFLYKETVNAGYVNYSAQYKKLELMAGLRAEQTISEGNSVTLANVVKRNYTQLFPSVFLSYNQSENNQFSFAYSRRVQRPNYEKLNPFLFFLDQYTYQQGNPQLKASVSDNMEISHTWKQFLTTSFGWQRIKDPSITVTEQNDTSKITYAIERNLSGQYAYSFGLNAGLPVTKWWSTQNNLQAFYLGFKYKDDKNDLDAGQVVFQFNSSNSFVLGRGWTAEINGSYQSPLQYGIFKVRPQWEIGAGVKKELMKKRASIRFSVDDFFNTSNSRVSTQYQNMNISLYENGYNTIARLTFSMKFGKNDAQNRRRSSAASEERSRLNTGGGK